MLKRWDERVRFRTPPTSAVVRARATEGKALHKGPPMLTPTQVLSYVKAQPFRPFRLHMASGRTFDVRHPEMIKVLKNYVLIFKAADDSELPDEWESISLMLTESISHLEAPVH